MSYPITQDWTKAWSTTAAGTKTVNANFYGSYTFQTPLSTNLDFN